MYKDNCIRNLYVHTNIKQSQLVRHWILPRSKLLKRMLRKVVVEWMAEQWKHSSSVCLVRFENKWITSFRLSIFDFSGIPKKIATPDDKIKQIATKLLDILSVSVSHVSYTLENQVARNDISRTLATTQVATITQTNNDTHYDRSTNNRPTLLRAPSTSSSLALPLSYALRLLHGCAENKCAC